MSSRNTHSDKLRPHSGRRLLGGNRDFTLLWSGQVISSLGSATSMLSYPLLVLLLFESAALVGLTMAVAMVARLLAGLPGGLLVDRLDKRRLMLGCDVGRAVVQGAVALAVLGGRVEIGLVLVAVALEGALSAVFEAAEPPAVRHVVHRDQLALALARNQARMAGAMLVGPPVGGLLFSIAPALPFAFDAVSYLVSAACIVSIRTPMPSTMSSTTGPNASPVGDDDGDDSGGSTTANAAGKAGAVRTGLRQIAAGLAFAWRQRFLRTTFLLIAGNNLVSNALFVLLIVMSQRHGDSGLTTGSLLAIASVGMMAGSILAPALVSRLTVRTILILNRCVWTVLIASFLVIVHPFWFAAMVGGMFFLGPVGNTAVTTRQMQLTGDDMQGRARSAAGILTGISGPLGAGAAGIVLGLTGPTVAVGLLAGWVGLMTLVAWLSPAIRADGRVRVAPRSG